MVEAQKSLHTQNAHDRIINLRYALGLLRLTKNPFNYVGLGAASLHVARALEALLSSSTQDAHLSATHIDTPRTHHTPYDARSYHHSTLFIARLLLVLPIAFLCLCP